MKDFEPKIMAFCCNWCAYAGADLAGTSRTKYPPNISIVRVMCSGMVHPAFILESFRSGADGVLIAGCHPGDCHYISGNYKARRRYLVLRRALGQMGIEPRRLRFEWVSAAEGEKFAKVVRDMVREVKELGPNPIKGEPHG